MASEPTPTLLEDLIDEADTMDTFAEDDCSDAEWASEIKARASRLREAAGRLRKEFDRLCWGPKFCDGGVDCTCGDNTLERSLVERINGGPLVTSGADPEKK